MVMKETQPLGAYSDSSSYSSIPPSFRNLKNWLNKSLIFFLEVGGGENADIVKILKFTQQLRK
jgi:hypothetical protein